MRQAFKSDYMITRDMGNKHYKSCLGRLISQGIKTGDISPADADNFKWLGPSKSGNVMEAVMAYLVIMKEKTGTNTEHKEAFMEAVFTMENVLMARHAGQEEDGTAEMEEQEDPEATSGEELWERSAMCV